MVLQTLEYDSFKQPSPLSHEPQAVANALEEGKIVHLPRLGFPLTQEESALLNAPYTERSAKNISYHPQTGHIKGSDFQSEPLQQLQAMMKRYSQHALQLLHNLIPHYEGQLIMGRTSYRPIEIRGRKTSLRKDDTRLHVDAFPATPTGGKRIVRVFTNINPMGESRIWHTGEPFSEVVKKFLPYLKSPKAGSRALLSFLKITKSYRTLYDHYMLQLHNLMKESDIYQNSVSKQKLDFSPGTSWVVMTDSVSHAALSGRFVLEQTFYLDPDHMANPALSPLYILSRTLKKVLV